jgi:hypothetical protein
MSRKLESEINTELMSIFENLIEFIQNQCACAIDEKYKNDLTNETHKCPINCCYTATSLAILMRLYLLNNDIYILEFPKRIIFPNISNELTGKLTDELTGKLTDELTGKLTDELTGKLTDELTDELSNELTGKLTTTQPCFNSLRDTYNSDNFFLGIVNTVGLLWDATSIHKT